MTKTDPFEAHAERYDRWFETHRHAFESELSAVGSLLPEGGRGLEIGVGTGRFAHRIGITIGLEPAGAMRKMAESRGIEIVEGVAEALPFPDASFEYALMVTTVCFLDDVHAAFAEVYRVLAAGGVFVVGLIDGGSPLGRKYQARKRRSLFYEDARLHSASEVETALREAGFADLLALQTIFGDPERMTETDPVRPGHGEGGFVAIRAVKSRLETAGSAQ